MKLYEFQGKKLLAEKGIPIPKGTLLGRHDVAPASPVVLKAQVLTGGRGKAGGVVVARGDASQAQEAVRRLFDLEIKGERTAAVLAEPVAEIEREYYVSITIDGERGTPLFVACAAGGTEIEEISEKTPERILKLPFDLLTGPQDHHLNKIASFLGHKGDRRLIGLLADLYRVWRDAGATLVEINPLAFTPQGFVALDAKVDLDDDAPVQNAALAEELRKEQADLTGCPCGGEKNTITYVQLDGDIGFISDGAGTGMLTIDLLADLGGKAADFCEMGGITNPDVIYQALELVVRNNPKIKSLLIILIGGFNRMDEMAEGIVRFYRETAARLPLFVRLCGTMELEGKRLMEQAGFDVYDDLLGTVRAAVAVKGAA